MCFRLSNARRGTVCTAPNNGNGRNPQAQPYILPAAARANNANGSPTAPNNANVCNGLTAVDPIPLPPDPPTPPPPAPPPPDLTDNTGSGTVTLEISEISPVSAVESKYFEGELLANFYDFAAARPQFEYIATDMPPGDTIYTNRMEFFATPQTIALNIKTPCTLDFAIYLFCESIHYRVKYNGVTIDEGDRIETDNLTYPGEVIRYNLP